MPDIRVRIGSQNRIKVTSSISGSSSMSLAELSDMNITGPSEGMVLVYNASTNKWDATLDLTPGNVQNLDINGGNF